MCYYAKRLIEYLFTVHTDAIRVGDANVRRPGLYGDAPQHYDVMGEGHDISAQHERELQRSRGGEEKERQGRNCQTA